MIRRLSLAFVALAALGAVPFAAAHTSIHFDLDRSVPADEATVAAADTVHMWFTQVPQDGATTVRVIDANGDPVETGDLIQDEADGKIFRLPIGEGLAAGTWTVAWRSMASDGHVVRGDFGFTVSAEN